MFGWFKKESSPDQPQAPPPESKPQPPVSIPPSQSAATPKPPASAPPRFVPKPTNVASAKNSLFKGMNFKSPSAAPTAPVAVPAPAVGQYVPVSLASTPSHPHQDDEQRPMSNDGVTESTVESFLDDTNKESSSAAPTKAEATEEAEEESAFDFMGGDEQDDDVTVTHPTPESESESIVPSEAPAEPTEAPSDVPTGPIHSDWDCGFAMAAETLTTHHARVLAALHQAQEARTALAEAESELAEVREGARAARAVMETAVAEDRFEDADRSLRRGEELAQREESLAQRVLKCTELGVAADAHLSTLVEGGGVSSECRALRMLESVLSEEHARYRDGQRAVHAQLEAMARTRIARAEDAVADGAAVLALVDEEEAAVEAAVAGECQGDLDERVRLDGEEGRLEAEIEELLQTLRRKQEELEGVCEARALCLARIDAARDRARSDLEQLATRREEAGAAQAGNEAALEHARAMKAENEAQREVTARNAQRAQRDASRAEHLRTVLSRAHRRRAALQRAVKSYRHAKGLAAEAARRADAKSARVARLRVEGEARLAQLHAREAELLKTVTECDAELPVLASEKRAAVAAKDFKAAAGVTGRIGEIGELRGRAETELAEVAAALTSEMEAVTLLDSAETEAVEAGDAERAQVEQETRRVLLAASRAMACVCAAAAADAAALGAAVEDDEAAEDLEAHAFPLCEGEADREDAHCAVLAVGRAGRRAGELLTALTQEQAAARAAEALWAPAGDVEEVVDEEVAALLGDSLDSEEAVAEAGDAVAEAATEDILVEELEETESNPEHEPEAEVEAQTETETETEIKTEAEVAAAAAAEAETEAEAVAEAEADVVVEVEVDAEVEPDADTKAEAVAAIEAEVEAADAEVEVADADAEVVSVDAPEDEDDVLAAFMGGDHAPEETPAESEPVAHDESSVREATENEGVTDSDAVHKDTLERHEEDVMAAFTADATDEDVAAEEDVMAAFTADAADEDVAAEEDVMAAFITDADGATAEADVDAANADTAEEDVMAAFAVDAGEADGEDVMAAFTAEADGDVLVDADTHDEKVTPAEEEEDALAAFVQEDTESLTDSRS